jgi:hypothetical protein
MTDQDKFRLLLALQSNKVLAGVGVVVVEGTSPQLLRLPSATGPKLYIVVSQFDSTNLSWSELNWRYSTKLHLSKAGIHITDMAFSHAIGSRYACFIVLGNAASAEGDPITAATTGSDSQSVLLMATKQMQETQMSFNLQYLQLQSQMQHENRSYTAISNIMKTKHDTVKNSISNVR